PLFGRAFSGLSGPGRHMAAREKIKCSCAREEVNFAIDGSRGAAIMTGGGAVERAGVVMRRIMADWNKVGKRFCCGRMGTQRRFGPKRRIDSLREKNLPEGANMDRRREFGHSLRPMSVNTFG